MELLDKLQSIDIQLEPGYCSQLKWKEHVSLYFDDKEQAGNFIRMWSDWRHIHSEGSYSSSKDTQVIHKSVSIIFLFKRACLRKLSDFHSNRLPLSICLAISELGQPQLSNWLWQVRSNVWVKRSILTTIASSYIQPIRLIVRTTRQSADHASSFHTSYDCIDT